VKRVLGETPFYLKLNLPSDHCKLKRNGSSGQVYAAAAAWHLQCIKHEFELNLSAKPFRHLIAKPDFSE